MDDLREKTEKVVYKKKIGEGLTCSVVSRFFRVPYIPSRSDSNPPEFFTWSQVVVIVHNTAAKFRLFNVRQDWVKNGEGLLSRYQEAARIICDDIIKKNGVQLNRFLEGRAMQWSFFAEWSKEKVRAKNLDNDIRVVNCKLGGLEEALEQLDDEKTKSERKAKKELAKTSKSLEKSLSKMELQLQRIINSNDEAFAKKRKKADDNLVKFLLECIEGQIKKMKDQGNKIVLDSSLSDLEYKSRNNQRKRINRLVRQIKEFSEAIYNFRYFVRYSTGKYFEYFDNEIDINNEVR